MEEYPHPPKSLVKFNEPIRLTGGDPTLSGFTFALPDTSYNLSNRIPGSVDSRELLRSILPPRTWREGSSYYTQEVSPNLTTRDDIMRLQTMLDFELESRQARSQPICPVREDLFSQAFDELIRQVSIECPERGLFLLRVRDERRMTVESHQTLYQHSVALSHQLGKHLQSSLPSAFGRHEALLSRKAALERQVTDLKRKLEVVRDREESASREQQSRLEREEALQRRKNDHLEAILAVSASQAQASGGGLPSSMPQEKVSLTGSEELGQGWEGGESSVMEAAPEGSVEEMPEDAEGIEKKPTGVAGSLDSASQAEIHA